MATSEDAVDNVATDEDAVFIMGAGDMRPVHVKMQRLIESALHVIHEATLNRRTEAMVGTKDVSLTENTSHEAAKGRKTTVYQAVERIVCRVVARSAVNVVIHMNVDNFVKSVVLFRHPTPTISCIRHSLCASLI